MPLGIRATVEIRAEITRFRRVGVNLPTAIRTGFDSRLRWVRVILEGSVLALEINDNGIICLRLGNQCATALGIICQSDRAVAIRIGRDQANRIAILDAMDRDIIRRFDRNKAIRCNLAIDRNIFICSRRGNLNLFVCGNLTNIHIALRGNLDVTICRVFSSIRMIIMDINGPKDFDIAFRRLDGQVAQACAFAAAQTSCIRHTFRAYGYLACTAIDGKCRVRQFRLTDKAMNCCRVVTNIIPAILVCPTNGNIRLASSPAVIIRLIIIWQLRNAGWHIAYPVGVHTILVCTRSYTTGDIEDLIFFRTGYPRELTSAYLRGRRIRRCLFTASKVLDDRTRNLPGRCHSRRVFILICNGYEMLTVKILAVRIRLTVILRSSKISKFPDLSKHIASPDFLLTIQLLIVVLPIDNKESTLTVAIGIRFSIDRLDHAFPSRCLSRFSPLHKIMVHERFIPIHGCDIARKGYIANSGIATSGIDEKRSAIELETCFVLDIDIATRRFDNTIVLTGVRTAKERCAICARRQRTATRADIGIDVDAALIVAIRISIEDDIQCCRCMDIRIDVDTFLCFQRQGILVCCRLIHFQNRRQRDICIVIGRVCRLDLDIIILQDIGNRRGL